MGNLALLALRIVLAVALAGSVFVQAVMVPLLAIDLSEDFSSDVADVRVPLIGIVLLIGGAAVLIAGVALVVVVLRMLLAQAVARDTEAHHLQAELDEVI